MAYSDFKSLEEVITKLDLTVNDRSHWFAEVSPQTPSPTLIQALEEGLELAVSISTEKARSELIVTPILMEVWRVFNHQIGYFSGCTLAGDPGTGLTGECDFILSLNPTQIVITAPILTIVEAKDNRIKAGLGQCAAQLVGAWQFNQRQGVKIETLYGAVTTGVGWQFLELHQSEVRVDRTEYSILQLDKILGILCNPFRGLLP